MTVQRLYWISIFDKFVNLIKIDQHHYCAEWEVELINSVDCTDSCVQASLVICHWTRANCCVHRSAILLLTAASFVTLLLAPVMTCQAQVLRVLTTDPQDKNILLVVSCRRFERYLWTQWLVTSHSLSFTYFSHTFLHMQFWSWLWNGFQAIWGM